MYDYEQKYYKKGFNKILGLDEAGRGCIAGPLVVAGVIFPKGYTNNEINDSKKLSAKKRNILFNTIIENCLDYHIVVFNPSDVDLFNPKQCALLGMKYIVENIKTKPDFVLTDFEKPDIKIPYEAIVKGDTKSISIAASSILAKVYRDRIMQKLDDYYPQYHFKNNQGYLTKHHLQGLKNGVLKPIKGIHRFSYKPIKK